MKKRFVPIYSILAIAIVLLAALAPSCGGGGATTGTIVVKATLCGVPWPAQATGAVNYTLTPTGGSPINGNAVPTTHSNMTATTWTCAYLGGGPAGTFLNGIQPSASQTLVAGGTITFTFDFELDQDAAIEWLTWTIDDSIWQNPGFIEAVPCQILDAHFQQWIEGCPGYNVTMNETSVLDIMYLGGPAPTVTIVAVDNPCAVNKTPDPRQKVDQWPSFFGERTQKGENITLDLMLPPGPHGVLDVHTVWNLVKGVNYTKDINWLGISTLPMFDLNGPHPCVLFELVLPPVVGIYTFQIQATAEVDLVGDTDVNPANNYTMSPPIQLIVNVGP